MTEICAENLREVYRLLVKIPEDVYTHKSRILSGSSIGGHIRHILEFYQCLLQTPAHGVVNYDLRKRDLAMETSLEVALHAIERLLSQLEQCDAEAYVLLCGAYTSDEAQTHMVESSMARELVYNLEHTIHHQALIRAALIEQRYEYLISDTFGLAPSTQKNRSQCAQSQPSLLQPG
jgi:uncharacterized damage-inducible protein DinB